MEAANKISIVHHVIFWISIIAYFVITSNITFFEGYQHLIESTLLLVFIQMVVAYILVYVLVPYLFEKKRSVLFFAGLGALLSVCLIFYMGVRVLYFDPNYQHVYTEASMVYVRKPFLERLLDLNLILSKFVKFLTPALLLIMWQFYKNQKNYLLLKEQKKSAELSALRNQINPHFLFNTLNNLYALSLEKSDRAPLVIEKLSEMLDYMLYQCEDKLVLLSKEIELLKNYIWLEEVRYGDRVEVNLHCDVSSTTTIAPLILLTFVENAFKHGVSQELNKAIINISIEGTQDTVTVKIENSKPISKVSRQERNGELGLRNVRQQLDLVYGQNYKLDIIETENMHTVHLNIHQV